jgi:type II secretory pathway component PulF
LKTNPYEPAAQLSPAAAHRRRYLHGTYWVSVSKIAFWFGTLLFVLGSLTSFYPGAEAAWFGTTAVLVGFGFFVPSRNYRIATLVIVALCLFWTYTGYVRGLEFQRWLDRQP